MRGVNKVIIVGNLGGDPETRDTPSGGVVANISVATSEEWTDKNTGQKQSRTEWHRITLFNRLGEIARDYCKKGSQVYIEGSLRTDKYQDKKTGEDKYSTSIIANNLQLLGGRSDNNQSDSQAANRSAVAPAGAEFDDDIPFSPMSSMP